MIGLSEIMFLNAGGISSETFQDIATHSPTLADLKLLVQDYTASGVQDIRQLLLQCGMTALSIYGFLGTTYANFLAMFSVPNKLTTIQILSHSLTTRTAIEILKAVPLSPAIGHLAAIRWTPMN